MADPGMIVTGATGFVGRHVLETFAGHRRIWALSRSSPSVRGIAIPAGVRWIPVDVADGGSVNEAIERISREGSVDTVVHLAGHYDFTGMTHEDYERTNVLGTRNILEAAKRLGIRDFILASSVAACQFPAKGVNLDESSPADGDTPYAASKRDAERLVAASRERFRAWIVRFAALFSDWCEYEPLFRFLESWLAATATKRIVAGRGLSAVPYLHVRDAMSFLQGLLDRRDRLDCRRVLLASPSQVATHLELFEAGTSAHFGARSRPLLLPGTICRCGLLIREMVGYAYGLHAFERPWMGRMIDKQLRVDSSATQAALGWSPRPRFTILRRMPFLIENRKSHHAEWFRRNHAALRLPRRRGHSEIARHLDAEGGAIVDAFLDYVTDGSRRERFPHLGSLHRVMLEADTHLLIDRLVAAVRSGEKAMFADHCRELVGKRAVEGTPGIEWATALDVVNDLCERALARHGTALEWQRNVYDNVTMTVQFGVDAVLDVSETGAAQAPV